MASFGLIIFFLSTFFINFSLITVQSAVDTAQPIYVSHFCLGGNYTANSTYDTNLNILLSSLSSNGNANSISTNGFYNSTAGRNTDIVYGALQCRGDVTFQECRTCVDKATQEIREEDKCPVSKQAIIWYHTCMLRYSNESFLSTMQENPNISIWNSNIITNNSARFNQIAASLLSVLTTKATSPSSNNTLFAAGVENVPNTDEKVYALVQCTSDLNSSICDKCLGRMIQQLPVCCNDKQGGRVITPSCNFRYEIYIFFRERVNDSLPLAPLSPPEEQPRLPPSTNTTTSSNGK